MKKRLLSLVLAAAMVLTMLPMPARAAESGAEEPVVTEPVEQTTAVTEAPVTEPPEVRETETPETEASEPLAQAAEVPGMPAAEPGSFSVTAVPDTTGLPSDEELFAGYAEQQFRGGVYALGTAGGNTLTGDTKLAYDALVPVLREIAAGRRSGSIISIGQPYGGNTPDVAVNFAGTDVGAVYYDSLLSALLADLPYELYWFDKTTGIGAFAGYSAKGLYLEIAFSVAGNYRGSEEYTVDTAITGAASTAAANAKAVVDQYAAKSDYDKLVAYRDWICAAVSYNYNAASAGNFAENCDPWQLIYVFDGDSSTNVVCEGYSKALQYLCDMSTFQQDVLCYIVTGGLNGGGHMWNLVRIEGLSYLVDVTNCDVGTVGSDKLFLVGGAAQADGSYKFIGITFTYDNETTSLWGSDILTLALSDYDPSSGPSQSNLCGENLVWSFDSATGTLTITETASGTGGALASFDREEAPWYDLADSITAIDVQAGTGLGDWSTFYGLSQVTSIRLPKTLQEVTVENFNDMWKLETISFPDGNDHGLSVVNGSVLQTTGEKVILTATARNITGYTIPDSVTCIGISGIGAADISELTIPAGVTELQDYALQHCSSITSVIFEGSAPAIGENAFWNITAAVSYPAGDSSWTGVAGQNYGGTLTWEKEQITSGTCGDNLVWSFEEATGTLTIAAVDGAAFTRMNDYEPEQTPWYSLKDSITTVEIRDVSYLGTNAFYGLDKMTAVRLPGTLSYFHNPFETCTSLAEISFPEGNENGFYVTDDGTMVLQQTQSMGIHLWAVVPALTGSVKLPSQITAIQTNAFLGCGGITDLDLPEDLVSILGCSFTGCTGVTRLTIHDKIQGIGAKAFLGCENLTHILFTGNSPYLKSDAFAGLTATVSYYSTTYGWEEKTSDGFGGTITWDARTPPTTGTCGDNLTWRIDDNNTLIISGTGDMYDFGEDSNLPPWHYYGGYDGNIQYVEIGENVTGIGSYAFACCHLVDQLTIPAAVGRLGSRIVNTGVNSVVFQGDVPQLEEDTFQDICAYVYYPADNAAWTGVAGQQQWAGAWQLRWFPIGTGGDFGEGLHWEFDAASGKLTVSGTGGMPIFDSYPDPYNEDCIVAPWQPYYEQITSVELMDGVTSITPFSFADCVNMTELVIPDSVTAIYEFSIATGKLKELIIPASVTILDVHSGIAGLEEIVVAEDNLVYSSRDGILFNKDQTALLRCPVSRAGELVIPEGVITLGEWSFSGCDNLTAVTIPGSVRSIENSAFPYCGNLTSVTIGQGVTSIGQWAFQSCPKLASVSIPRSVVSIGDYAFEDCPSLSEITFGHRYTDILSIGLDAFELYHQFVDTRIYVPNPEKIHSAISGYNWSGAYRNVTYLSTGETDANVCGENLVWEFDADTGILTIRSEDPALSSGAIYAYENSEAPWYPHEDAITRIEMKAGTAIGGSGTFFGLSRVTAIELPRTLRNVTMEDFDGLWRLETIAFPDGNDNGLSVADGVSVLKTEGQKVTLTATAVNITDYSIPEGVTCIGTDSIGVEYLFRLTIPEDVSEIQDFALRNSGFITDLIFTGSAPVIGEYAFYNIGANAVYPAGDETWADVIGKNYGGTLSWTPAGETAVSGVCGKNLRWSFDEATAALAIFADNAASRTSMHNYEVGYAPWYALRDRIKTIDVQYASYLSPDVFAGLEKVDTLYLPQNLDSMAYALNGCDSLTTIVFPNGNIHGMYAKDGAVLQKNAYNGAVYLVAVAPGTVSADQSCTVPDEVTWIPEGAFAGAESIRNLTLPDGLLVIGNRAFGNLRIEALTIPAQVQSIWDYAFVGCENLRRIIFTGDAPAFSDSAFTTLDGTVAEYPANQEGWDEAILKTYGGNVTWKSNFTVVMDQSNSFQVQAGKSVTLKASLGPSNLTGTSIVWSLKDPADSAYATITAAGKFTAKAVTERHSVTVVAASKDGKAEPAEWTLELIPKASGVELSRKEAAVTGQTLEIDLNAPDGADLVLTAAVLPEGAEQGVTWKVSDTKGQYVTYAQEGNTLTLSPTGATGSVTVTATANDGSRKAAKVTVKFVRLAHAVTIRNAPEWMLSGKSMTLTTDVASDKTLTSKTVLWSLSEDSLSYASITSGGKLTTYPVSAPVQIQVAAAVPANPAASHTVTIRLYPAVDSVRISGEGRTFADGEKITRDASQGELALSARCYPDGVLQEGRWAVSNASVASISEDGVLTVKKAGTTQVTFTASDGSGKKAALNVTFTKAVQSVEIAEPASALRAGQSATLEATALAGDGTPAANQKFNWYIDCSSNVASIGLSSGKITVKEVSEKAEVMVWAVSKEDTSIYGQTTVTLLPKYEKTLQLRDWYEGEDFSFNYNLAGEWYVEPDFGAWQITPALYLTADGQEGELQMLDPADCSFSSSKKSVADIDANGRITITGTLGSTTISAKYVTQIDGTTTTLTAKFTLTVAYYVDRVEIAEPASRDLRSGKTLTLKATAWADREGQESIPATNQKVCWESSNPEAATVSSSGKVTAMTVTENTTVTITARSDWDWYVLDEITLTIRPKQAYQLSITCFGEPVGSTASIPMDLCPGIGKNNLKAELYVSDPDSELDGSYVDMEDALWASSSQKAALFDEEGDLVFVAPGRTTISAKCSLTADGTTTTLTAKFTCKVVNSVRSIAISQKVPGAYLFSGKTLQLTASTNADATNKKVTWTSSDPLAAKVSASGLVTAGKVYEQTAVTITATAQDGFGAEESVELIIYPTAATVSILDWNGVLLDNRTVTVSLGDASALELQALVYPTGDTGALQEVSWSSSSTAVAQFADGRLLLKKAGTATIKATANDGSKKTVSFKLVITD